MARGEIPPRALEVFRLERVTALARTISQQDSKAVEEYALKTRVGTECVSHILQTLTDFDARATILSVDGVGAFDLISRNSMMEDCSTLKVATSYSRV